MEFVARPPVSAVGDELRAQLAGLRMTASSVSEGGASGGGKNVPPHKRNFFLDRRNLS